MEIKKVKPVKKMDNKRKIIKTFSPRWTTKCRNIYWKEALNFLSAPNLIMRLFLILYMVLDFIFITFYWKL